MGAMSEDEQALSIGNIILDLRDVKMKLAAVRHALLTAGAQLEKLGNALLDPKQTFDSALSYPMPTMEKVQELLKERRLITERKAQLEELRELAGID